MELATGDGIRGGPVAGAYRSREVNQLGMGAQLRQPHGYSGRKVMTRHLSRVFCVQPISNAIHGDRGPSLLCSRMPTARPEPVASLLE